jgi:hypothetical protein
MSAYDACPKHAHAQTHAETQCRFRARTSVHLTGCELFAQLGIKGIEILEALFNHPDQLPKSHLHDSMQTGIMLICQQVCPLPLLTIS